MSPLPSLLECPVCRGCGRLSNDEQTPWLYWQLSPLLSEEELAAYFAGIIFPVTCKNCQGSGEVCLSEGSV